MINLPRRDDTNPRFTKPIEIDYFFHLTQPLRFCLYWGQANHTVQIQVDATIIRSQFLFKLQTLADQQFVGEIVRPPSSLNIRVFAN